MKTLIRLASLSILAAALAVGSLSAAPGEGPRGPRGPGGAGERGPDLRRMAEHLDLTAEQREQVKVILEDARAQNESLINTLPGSDAAAAKARRERREAIGEETRGKIRAILTPEQAAKAEEGRARLEERRAGMKERREAHAAALGLTEDQKAAVQTLMEKQMAAAGALRRDDSLTREQKREKLQALREEFRAGMDGILTAEQKAKREELRANRPERPERPARGERRGREA